MTKWKYMLGMIHLLCALTLVGCSSDHISFNKCEQIVTNGSVV